MVPTASYRESQRMQEVMRHGAPKGCEQLVLGGEGTLESMEWLALYVHHCISAPQQLCDGPLTIYISFPRNMSKAAYLQEIRT